MRLLPLALLFAVAGCDASGLSEREWAELRAGEAEIALGETATVDGLAIRFAAVVGDSRCPAEVDCVWAGEATVALVVGDRRVEVRVVDPEAEPDAGVRIGDAVVYAVALVPLPRADGPSDARPVVSVSVAEA